jgi:transmembrane sensor
MLLALTAGVGCLGFGLSAYLHRSPAPSAMVPFSEIVTGSGEMATFTLTDGTAIRVGPHSTLRMSIENGNPIVWLDGRAFFGVQPDSTRNFTVRTAHGEAIALGTRFEVRSDEESFRVLVVEGNVRVSTAGAAIELADGLMSESTGGEPPSTSRVRDVDQMLDWMGPTLMFRNTPLHRAIGEIEARYDVEVELETISLGDITVTATFTDEQPGPVVSVLCEMIGAECLVEDTGRILIGQLSGPRASSTVSGR